MSSKGKILVTGGAGYVGSHAVKELQKRGYSTVVLDNLSNGHRELFIGDEFVEGDCSDAKLLKGIFSSQAIEAVMHFAAFAYVGESVEQPAKYYRNNVTHTLTLLEEMVKAGVKKFIFSSTCATYGIPQEDIITEDHPQHPINPYGNSKLMVERILRDFERAHEFRFVAFRYFNAAGADDEGEIGEWHDPETHLIPLILDTAEGRREFIQVFGNDYPTPDGTCIRDYIHVTDLAVAHILGLDYLGSGNPSGAFNLGNGEGYSVLQVIDAAAAVTGKKINTRFAPRRPGDPPRLVGSADKARRLLGWETRFPSLEAIMKTAWKWHQKLPALRK